MYIPPSNPIIIALAGTHRPRRFNLSELGQNFVGGVLSCVWCLSPLSGRQIKWCSPICSHSAWSWANPQSSEGLGYLLARQNFTCVICGLDWKPLASSLLGTRGIPRSLDYLHTFSIRLVKALKRLSPLGTKPEIDHFVPISRGGISLGFDNHRAICSTCHLAKTRIDNSGPRSRIPLK